MQTKFILAAFGLLITAGPAVAELDPTLKLQERPAFPSRDGRRVLFDLIDSNDDGKVTFEEIQAKTSPMDQEQFDSLDFNKDGALTPDELPFARRENSDTLEMLPAADENHDGQVTRSEFAAAFPEASKDMFTQLDRNGDGALSKDDQPSIRSDESRSGPRQHRMYWVGIQDELIQDADLDKNGAVTTEEMRTAKPGFPTQAFIALDTNGDGVLSAEDPAPVSSRGGGARRGPGEYQPRFP